MLRVTVQLTRERSSPTSKKLYEFVKFQQPALNNIFSRLQISISYFTFQVDSLRDHLLKLCMQSAIDTNDIHRLLRLAVKLNVPSIISSTDLTTLHNNTVMTNFQILKLQ